MQEPSGLNDLTHSSDTLIGMVRVTVSPATAARLKVESLERGQTEDEFIRALLGFADWALALVPYHEPAGMLAFKDLRSALERRTLAPDRD
jgi:hypothetical protein